MNQNNAAQPVLTDDEILRATINASDSLNITRIHEIGGPSRTIMEDAGLLELGRAIESALLSKLRAPVADERAAEPHGYFVQGDSTHLYIRGAKEPQLEFINGFDPVISITALFDKQPALASAPVADTGTVKIPLELASRISDALGRFVSDEGWGQADMDTADDLGAFLSSPASAPVAVEAQPVAWTNDAADIEPISDAVKRARPDLHSKIYTRPLYAAPQASEAVDRSPNLQGSSVDRSAELQGGASGPAYPNTDIIDLARAGMELHSPGMPEHTVCAELVRIAAALSAQPGAQRTGGSE